MRSSSSSSGSYYSRSADDDADGDRPSSSSSRTATSRSYDDEDLRDLDEELEEEEDEPSSRSRYEDLDEDRPSSSRSSSSSSSSRSSSSSSSSRSSSSSSRSSSARDLDERSSTSRSRNDDDEPGITVSGRAGYARYYDFNFITYGAELGVPVAETVALVAGIEGFSTQRTLSEETIQDIAEQYDLNPNEIDPRPWNTILPINLGVQYKAAGSAVRPYAGADFVVTPYTEDFKVALGARARVGADFMVARTFGFNLNLAAGIMSGKEFDQIQPGIRDTGLIPQVSGGTVFQF